MIKLIISIFVFLTLFIFNTAFVFAGILDVSFNAEPSATGDIALYWHAEDPEQGDVVLKYGIDKKYDQRYNFNISKRDGVINLVNIKANTIYHYILKQGSDETKDHQFSVMKGGDIDPDSDDDNDGVKNSLDNCPSIKNSDQKDSDGDGFGDVCDYNGSNDDDNDGIKNNFDNCRFAKNLDQKDTDGDGKGDACDDDYEKKFLEKCVDGTRIVNNYLYNRLMGKIILTVEDVGQAYYINPHKKTMHCLGNPIEAFKIMRLLSTGITNRNVSRIPIGYIKLSGQDIDGDGLSDIFEDAVWSNKNASDSNGDGISDKDEIIRDEKPIGKHRVELDYNFTNDHKGEIFLQVHNNGEAWYIYPDNLKRYFLGRPHDAFNIMHDFGLGISNADFDSL